VRRAGRGSKLYGYSAQGACKFGLYEHFKKPYSDIPGPDYTRSNKTSICVASSLSARMIADAALCPFEAIKVRVQRGYGVFCVKKKRKKEGLRNGFD